MSSVTQTYGANIAFIEELYERFRTDPTSVSSSWREFFEDYHPELDQDEEHNVGQPLRLSVGADPQPPQPQERPAESRPYIAPVPPSAPKIANATPLRGA